MPVNGFVLSPFDNFLCGKNMISNELFAAFKQGLKVCCVVGHIELMHDGSVSYPSVLEAICSYCSSVSLCRQCGNVFALKVNLWMHVKRRSRLLKCPGGNMICLFMHVALQRM